MDDEVFDRTVKRALASPEIANALDRLAVGRADRRKSLESELTEDLSARRAQMRALVVAEADAYEAADHDDLDDALQDLAGFGPIIEVRDALVKIVRVSAQSVIATTWRQSVWARAAVRRACSWARACSAHTWWARSPI
ncbi:hypothetical protein AB0J82_10715 [Asanoa sp. NPDC049518]|uniref:hypothetical protein n=1 Tax=unclassified Asanoa TaxID=2685164 RepID=UPI003432D52C